MNNRVGSTGGPILERCGTSSSLNTSNHVVQNGVVYLLYIFLQIASPQLLGSAVVIQSIGTVEKEMGAMAVHGGSHQNEGS